MELSNCWPRPFCKKNGSLAFLRHAIEGGIENEACQAVFRSTQAIEGSLVDILHEEILASHIDADPYEVLREVGPCSLDKPTRLRKVLARRPTSKDRGPIGPNGFKRRFDVREVEAMCRMRVVCSICLYRSERVVEAGNELETGRRETDGQPSCTCEAIDNI